MVNWLSPTFTGACIIQISLPIILLALLVSGTAAAGPSRNKPTGFIRAIDRMMVALGPESVVGSAAIRREYRDYLELLFLDEYTDLEGALATGGLALLPANPLHFNLAPRLGGAHPIAEKDLRNQPSYMSARPATIGCLPLSEREREVFQLIAEGRNNKEVAAVLHVSPGTVETHRAHIMEKLDVHSAAEIVLYAVRKGVIR